KRGTTPTSFSFCHLPPSQFCIHTGQYCQPVYLLASHTLRLLYSTSFVVALSFRAHFVTYPEHLLYPTPAKEEVGAYLLASWAIPEATRKEERYNLRKENFKGIQK
ncbi:hypothetical protein HOY80DRAFT_1015473, partial [Tuber brumale]